MSGKIVALRREYVRLTGSLAAGVLLSQLAYWFSNNRLRLKRGGKMWLAKTAAELSEECGLTAHEYKTSIRKLKELRLIVVEGHMWQGFRTSFIWLDQSMLNELGGESTDRSGKHPHIGRMESDQPYTETTNREYDREPQERRAPQERAKVVRAVPQQVGQRTREGSEPRPIEDWVADRPELAERRLKADYTGEEWIAKAGEILRCHTEHMDERGARLAANSLAMAWKRLYSRKYEEYVKDLTKKEMGQLRQFLQKVGEQSPPVMEYMLENWQKFGIEAKYRKGLPVIPERPIVGFLLQHYDVALQLIAKSEASPKAKLMEIEKQKSLPPMPTQEIEQRASYGDVLEAMRSFGNRAT